MLYNLNLRLLTLAVIAVCGLLGLSVPIQADDWKHHASIYVLTDEAGANLPAATVLENFPLLVRLHGGIFNFQQARPAGEDLRVTSPDGKALAFQIEEWDSQRQVASLWVLVPVIKGQARQELRLHWGNPAAASESDGQAVFSAATGYLNVMHLGDEQGALRDETGAVQATDQGTTSVPAVIGQGRHFVPGKGINCGEMITWFPTGAAPHSSQAWIRPLATNAIAVAWGNEHAQGKMTMRVNSPPHIRLECYFSGADVRAKGRLTLGEWVHVVHTYRQGESRVYVNGNLEGTNLTENAPLAIRSPARMYLGGWYGHYQFAGDLDEVRVSQVVRSPEWIRLEYENQKPAQTAVGLPVSPGSEFSVTPTTLELAENQKAIIKARAGGAQKVYWVLKRDGHESILATDQLELAWHSGRVAGDSQSVLQFRAIYPDQIRTVDIPVTVKETIPEPEFTLSGPATWNGRDAIEIVPVIANRAALRTAGGETLQYHWRVTGGAVIQDILPDRLKLVRSQYTGPLTVQATIDNGGAPRTASLPIRVVEPRNDPWMARIPEPDEKPEAGQFYARDNQNQGTLHYNGQLAEPADQVFLKVYADEQLVHTETAPTKPDKRYALTVRLKPGLIHYRIEFGAKVGGKETVLERVDDLVCGDAYLIDGQSNALATDTGEKSPPETSEWIRSYGRPEGQPGAGRQNLWCRPVWKAEKGERAELGWWGMQLARRLVESQKMPIFIINGAVGGTRIDQHQRNAHEPADLQTIYGRMLWRAREARITHGIRGIFWHQGESDQGADGPDGGYGWETYQNYFVEMSAGWKRDFPNVQHYYLFQIWPNSCSMGNGQGDMLREVQRNLPKLYSQLDVMSTIGISPPGDCHFPLVGWAEFARLIQPLVERDHYGRQVTTPITAPNLQQVAFTTPAQDSLTLVFNQPVVWDDALAGQLYLDDAADLVESGQVSGNRLILKLKQPSSAKAITYLKEMRWNRERLLRGTNGIAALTFCQVPIGKAVSAD
ncbi:MAG: DUF2341 domain-containing protein [Planctomycetes bacterium]|nr:DUF2341 domain-containing protein [Planctomycetota bacterium]